MAKSKTGKKTPLPSTLYVVKDQYGLGLYENVASISQRVMSKTVVGIYTLSKTQQLVSKLEDLK